MELERLNLQRAPEAQEEEEKYEDRSHSACINCKNIHNVVSKWMLPEGARAIYLERASCIPPPLFILAISVAELAIFIYYAVWKPQKQWITLDTGIWESPFIYRSDKRKEAWRFVSYMLVHAGIEHILGNLLLQLLLGIPLELVHKGHRVGLVYIAGVIGGSLASSIFDPLQGLVGASGGVYALIGGYFMNILVNFREMIPLFGVARLLFIFSIVGTDVGFALYRRFFSPVHGLQVSFVAHIAGGLAGMSVGYVIFSCFDKNFIKDPRFWVCITAYLSFVGFAVFFNVFFSPANQ
ncbi:rhomboid-related protein 2 [Varanus komodoensis]|uniref:rhomboid-related protein 2 n=1 Tax=Varanus komodoensis TaxID=61221 RepID=UPI001CF7C5E1|nr:rhomboid-related protein 2 [Varanus komodoensis]XP_044277264.1 rhomboid-related protein 2 [Varanus komodoensis]